MPNPLHFTGVLLLACTLSIKTYSQPLRWGTSFTPAWANGNLNGNAPNVGTMGLNASTAITIAGGVFTSSNGNNTPSVLGNNILVAGSTTRLNLSPNFTNSTDYVNTVITFSKLTSHINFRIGDIDKQNANSNSFYDRVTITGTDGTNTYYPTITKYDATTDPNFLVISGNTAYANTTNGQGGKTNSNNADQRGTINIDFGTTLLLSVTIRFDNAPGVQSNPGVQTLAIGEIAFIQPALPVKLTAFSASQQQNNIALKWTTVQEWNSERFEVQRSRPGYSWETIGQVAAAGNSNDPLHYTYTDINAPGTSLLYRLRQVDLDGQYEYSPVVRIDNKPEEALFNSFPNPFVSAVAVSIYSPVDQSSRTFLTDIHGRKIRDLTRFLYRGNNTFSINGLGGLSPGIYLVAVLDEKNNPLGQFRLLKN